MTGAGAASLTSLVAYALWTALLVLAIMVHRAVLVLGGRPANAFTPTNEDLGPFAARLARAHANCVENLPVFGAVVLAAVMMGRADVTDPLAPWVVVARLGQSGVHLASGGPFAVQVRFAFAVVQVLLIGWMGIALLT